MSKELAVWNDPKKIKEIFASKLSDDEFQVFLGMGKGLGANPFNREIWAVKYGNSPANIFLGRDFYRKKAQEQKDYDGHLVDSVYSKDKFSVKNGEPQHEYTMLQERGHIVGAYCIVRKKSMQQPYYVFVRIEEYDKGQSVWKEKKDTMIKKVAEAQGLRGAFQGIFAGTYDESELWKPDKVADQIPAETETKSPIDDWDKEVKKSANKRKKTIEPDINIENTPETLPEPSGEPIEEKTTDTMPDTPDPSDIDPTSPYYKYLEWMSKKKSQIIDLTGSDKLYYKSLKSFKLEKSSHVDKGNTDLMHNVMEMVKVDLADIKKAQSVQEKLDLEA